MTEPWRFRQIVSTPTMVDDDGSEGWVAEARWEGPKGGTTWQASFTGERDPFAALERLRSTMSDEAWAALMTSAMPD